MKRGDILAFPDFVFKDGGHANKLLVVLEVQTGHDGMLYGVLTTSQQDEARRRDYGCQPSRREFFIPAGNVFPKDTWILLNKGPYIRPFRFIKDKTGNGECKIVARLPDKKINEIKNCIDKHASAST